MRLTRHAALPALLLLASCSMLNPPPERTVRAPRDAVVAATVEVFERYRIPVETADATLGMVRSGPFVIRDGWNTRPLHHVVRCGAPDRADDASRSVTLHLRVRIPSEHPGWPRPDPMAPPRGPRATYGDEATSRFYLDGRGTLRRGEEELERRLAPGFVEELLDAIAREVGGAVDAVVAAGGR